MHRCAEINESLSILTNLIYVNSEQHVELWRSQKKRDLAEFRLESLSTGLVASDDINCDNAKAVGKVIQNALDNICIEDAVIPRKTQVRTLQFLKSGVKIVSKTVYIDPLILFTRLTALIQRDGKVEKKF